MPKRLNSLLLISLIIYVIFSCGYVDTVDADPSIETAYSLLERGSIYTKPLRPDSMLYHRTNDEYWVSKMGWLLPAIYVPCVLTGKAMGFVTGIPHRLVTEFFVSLVNGLFSALIIALTYMALLWSGTPKKLSLVVAISLGFATLMFPYSKSSHRETLQALLVLGVFFCAMAPREKLSLERASLFAGTGIGLAILTKIALIVPLAPVGMFLLARQQSVKSRLMFLGPILFCGFLHFSLASFAFGLPWSTGYSSDVVNPTSHVWSTPFFSGLYQQWISLESGIFWYSPALLLSVWLVARKAKDHSLGLWDVLLSLSIFLQSVFYARWWSPVGGAALGPRYLVTIIPLFALFWIGVRKISLRSDWQKYAAYGILGWSLFIQIVNVSVKPQQYWSMRAFSKSELSKPPWIANLELFTHKLHGNPEVYNTKTFGGDTETIDLRGFKTLAGFNYWWLHGIRLIGKGLPHKGPTEPNSISQMNESRKRN